MQGGALDDSHAVAEKSSEAGLLVEPMEKTNGWTVYQFGPQNWWSSGGVDLEAHGQVCGGRWESNAVGRPADGPCGTWWDPGGRKLREDEDKDGTWRHHKACVEAKQSREDAGSVRCSRKNLDNFAPEWVCILE